MLDARDKEVKAAQAESKAEAAEIEQEKEQCARETTEDEKLLADGERSATSFAVAYAKDLLRHYERVSKFRGEAASPKFAITSAWHAGSCCARRLTTTSGRQRNRCLTCQ